MRGCRGSESTGRFILILIRRVEEEVCRCLGLDSKNGLFTTLIDGVEVQLISKERNNTL